MATANRGLSIWESIESCTDRGSDRRYETQIGSIAANRLQAIAQDDAYFYLLDEAGDLHG